MNSKQIRTLTVHALLVAIMIILAFTPLAYISIPIGAAEITLMNIPVTAGVFFGGKKSGLILGFVFGLTSFLQCFIKPTPFSAMILPFSPVMTAVLCFIPRILMGFLAGLIFDAIQKTKLNKIISYAILSFIVPALNTLFFVGGFMLIFGNTEIYTYYYKEIFKATNVFLFFVLFCGVNAVLEIAVNFVVGIPMCKALEKVKK